MTDRDVTKPGLHASGHGGSVVISVDAMGSDRGPAAVVAGMAESAAKNPEIRFIVHGDEAELRRLVGRRKALAGRCDIRHAGGVVTMDDKPSQIVRKGDGTSMWSAIESVKTGEAGAAVSCGNTGALMALSMLRLRKLPGVNRPAIASAWRNSGPTSARRPLPSSCETDGGTAISVPIGIMIGSQNIAVPTDTAASVAVPWRPAITLSTRPIRPVATWPATSGAASTAVVRTSLRKGARGEGEGMDGSDHGCGRAGKALAPGRGGPVS